MGRNLFIRAIEMRDIRADGQSYVFSLPVIRNLGRLEPHKRVAFFVGENGIDKSTLQAVAVGCGFNPEGGSMNFNFFSKQTHSPLYNTNFHLYRRFIVCIKPVNNGQ